MRCRCGSKNIGRRVAKPAPRCGLCGLGARNIAKSYLAVDSLAIQRSLTILEDRYRQLREIGEKRFATWDNENADLKQQLAVQAESLQHSQIASDEQAHHLKALDAELAALKADHIDLTAAKDTADKSNADLKQQLAVQAESLRHSQIALTEAKEEAELLLLQLHQVQEELEHYFLRSQQADALTRAQTEQHRRSVVLLSRLLQLGNPASVLLTSPSP